MNKLFIEGCLGKDVEVKATANGRKYAVLAVAVNWNKVGESKDKADRTTWYNVVSFNERHTGKMTEYLTKGTRVMVTGNLEAEMITAKDGQRQFLNMNVIADSIEFPMRGSNRDRNNNDATTSTSSNRSKKTEDNIPADEPVVNTTKKSGKVATPVPATPEMSGDDDNDLPF